MEFKEPAIRIEISDRQSVCRLARRRIAALAAFLLQKAIPARDAKGVSTLTLLVTDNGHMPEFNCSCFGVREVTDIIAAAYRPLPGMRTWEGELVVNAERALDVVTACARSSRLPRTPHLGAREWDASSEFALYVAHGVDHLTGADDTTPRTRRLMRQRELRWLRAAQARGLLAKLIEPAPRRARMLS